MSCLPKLGETRVIKLMWVGMRMLVLDISGSRLASPRFGSRFDLLRTYVWDTTSQSAQGCLVGR